MRKDLLQLSQKNDILRVVLLISEDMDGERVEKGYTFSSVTHVTSISIQLDTDGICIVTPEPPPTRLILKVILMFKTIHSEYHEER